jgi:serine/threonine-protein kinase
LIGETIGSFRIASWLGAGSLSIVYRAVHKETGEPAAVKVSRQGNSAAPARVARTAEILRRFHHANIVRFLAMGRKSEVTYLATEYVSGRTLGQILADAGALPWPKVIELALQLCAALHEIHQQGVIHRNVKPSHLIVTENRELKLIGFGLARSPDEPIVSSGGLARGTPGYMAPEQICGSTAISRQTDLYALGVVIWHLLTGAEPYHDLWDSGQTRSGASLALAHLTRPPARPRDRVPEVPEALDDLVIRLMAKRPGDRPPDAAQVAKILARIPRMADRGSGNVELPVTPARLLLPLLPSWLPGPRLP